MTNRAYQQTLENRYQRAREQHAEIKEQYDNAPQAREARQREASPELYYSFKTRAAQARLGALVMWGICFIIGSIFMVQSYSLPGFAPEISALLVIALWLSLTVLVGIASEMVVQFGFEIQPRVPNSDRRAIRSIWICGIGFLLSFAALLILRTVISLPLLIVCQAFFELFALVTGSLFRALAVYYAHLPALRDRLDELQERMDQLSAELADFSEDAPTKLTEKDSASKFAKLPVEIVAASTTAHNGHESKKASLSMAS